MKGQMDGGRKEGKYKHFLFSVTEESVIYHN